VPAQCKRLPGRLEAACGGLNRKKEYERASETADDVGDDCGEPGIFSGSSGAYGHQEMKAGAGSSGRRRDCADGSGLEVRRGGDAAGSSEMCGAVCETSRGEDGVVVTLPNFGDERAIADTLRLAGLGVPVLVQATPIRRRNMTIRDRRDSFCGKIRLATT